jgi:hypothetical protein
MSYRLDVQSLIPEWGKGYLFPPASRPGLGPKHTPYPMRNRGSFPGVKRPRHETDHSPSYSAELMDGGAIHPLRLTLQGMVLN